MRPRSTVFLASSLSLYLVALPAFAEDCPEGDWFCEPAPEAPSPLEPLPDTAPAPTQATQKPRRAGRWRGEFLPEEPPPPPRRARRSMPRREWGFDVHVLGALMGGEDAHPDASMGGLGFGLRFRPIPYFSLDGTVELAVGTDYNGDERTEAAFLLNAVGFFNPKDRVQAYAFAGLGFGRAEVTLEPPIENLPLGNVQEHYRYFGMQLGGGVELRLTRRTALRLDLMGFVRARTDDDYRSRPEFVDPATSRVTNTSGGALLRAGAVFYW